MMLVSQSVVSLNRWAVLLGILGNTCVAKQSLWERIHQGTVDFLQRVLAIVLGQQILPDTFSSVPKALRAFTRVLVQDSTTIKLSEKLAAVFPGSSNQFGVKNGQLKIQAIYNLLTQRFISFGLSGFTRNDQAAAGDVLTVLQAGTLALTRTDPGVLRRRDPVRGKRRRSLSFQGGRVLFRGGELTGLG